MTNEEAISIWAVLGAATSGRELNETDLAIRARLITDLDFDQAQEAAAHLARTSSWLPSVAQLRDEVVDDGIPDAGAAWEEVCAVVQRLGWSTPPSPGHFSHPAVHAAVRALGSWQDFCAADPNITRAHWLKHIYPAAAARARHNQAHGAAGDTRALARFGAVKQLDAQPEPVQRDRHVDADGFHIADPPAGIRDHHRREA